MLVFAAVAAATCNNMVKQRRFFSCYTAFLVIGLLSLIISVGCSGASKNDVSRTAATPPAAKTASPAVAGGANAKPSTEIRKVIETAQVNLETKDLTQTENATLALLAKRKGKADSSNVTLDGNGRRSGIYTLRIPSGQLLDYVNELAALPGIVVRQRSLSAQDVTEEFVDIAARLENMQRHEVRLREILAKANTVEEILKVEKELATVRAQIESTTGRMKAMSGKIDMSTLQLRITEVTVITDANFFGKLRSIIRDSWVAAGDVFLYLVATIIILSPIALLVLGFLWWRRRRKAAQSPNTVGTPPPV